MQNLWTGSVAGRGGGERGWAAQGPRVQAPPSLYPRPGANIPLGGNPV